MTLLPWGEAGAEAAETIDRGELLARVRQLAAMLEARRVGPDFRVVGLIRRPRWLAPLVLACARKRTPLVPLEPSISRDALVAAATRLAPALVVTDDPSVGEPAGVVHLGELPAAAGDPGASADEPAPPAEAERPVLFLPSSDPCRFAMFDEPALLAAADAVGERYGIGAPDRVLVLLPAVGPGPFLQLAASIVPVAAGAASILGVDRRDTLPQTFARGLAAGATVAFLTPRQMAALLAEPLPRRPSSLRLVVAGGGPLSPAIRSRFEAAFGAPVAVTYGTAELGPFLAGSPPGAARSDAALAPLACELRIDPTRIRDAEADVFLERRAAFLRRHGLAEAPGAGEARPVLGEIVVRGASRTLGYYKNPQLTRTQTTSDGYLRTGDVGFVDPEGRLVVTGSLDEVIVRAGRRVVAHAIDAVLCTHPLVAEARTVGVRDDKLGERIHTACVLRPGAAAFTSAAELAAWLRDRLPPEGAPDDVSILGQLPRTSAGCVSPALLRGVVSGELARAVYAGLTRPRFRRAPPSDGDAALATLDRALRSGGPIRFVSHWGAGRRADLREVDELALERLRAFVACAAQTCGVEAELTLLLADVHARVNEQDFRNVEAYHRAIRARAHELSDEHVTIRCRRLGELWRDHGLDLEEVLRAAEAPALVEEFDRLGLCETLLFQAGRRANGNPGQAARRYYQVCRTEAPVIAAAYRDALWLTYADPDHGDLLPPLPRFYLFSYRRGRTNRPWFEDEAV